MENKNNQKLEIFQRLVRVETSLCGLKKDFDDFVDNHFKTFESKMCTRYESLIKEQQKLKIFVIKITSIAIGGGLVALWLLERLNIFGKISG